MRLRNLRKLEEFEIRKEFDALTLERTQILALLDSDAKQWKVIAHDIKDVAKKFGPETALGKRRTSFEEVTATDTSIILEAMIEREPITVVVSDKGWIRALKGHIDDLSRLEFKQGDALKIAFKAQTSDKILVFTSDGKAFTLVGANLPGGRGQGEPIRLMADMDESAEILAVFVHQPDTRRLVVTREGKGFILPEVDAVAQTKKGKQIVNCGKGDQLVFTGVIAPGADHLAVIGTNRKLLLFPLIELAEMSRGAGVRVQRYKDGTISDARGFKAAEGISWTDTSGRVFNRSMDEMRDWLGHRGDAGRLAPMGFPRSNKFGNGG